MMIDGFDGERYDLETEPGDPGYLETETLLTEVRPQTVQCVVEGEIPGRHYWQDQLDEIDEELQFRGVFTEHPVNRLWRGYVTTLQDALAANYRRRKYAGRLNVGDDVVDLKNYAQGLGVIIAMETTGDEGEETPIIRWDNGKVDTDPPLMSLYQAWRGLPTTL